MIRKFIKEHAEIKKHLYGLRRLLYYFMFAINRIHKTDKKKVLFNNFQGKGFGGNPRAIALYLHSVKPEVKLLWICDGKNTAKTLPAYIEAVRIGSYKYFYELATCGTWVFNILPARGLIKRKNQLYIQTYHGDRGPKKVHYQNIGKKATDAKYAIHDEICDYGVTGSKVGERMFRNGIGFHGKLLKYGMPRNDCLINIDEEKCKRIRASIGVSDSQYVVLYAPTFRQGQTLLECGIDFESLLNAIERKTGKSCACLYRTHFHTDEISFTQMPNNKMINMSEYPDMADLLMISDMLITDYSSSAGDFCIKHKPVILFIDKTENYNRKLVYNMEDTPHFIVHNQNDLEDLIKNLNDSSIIKNCDDLIAYYGIYDTGIASKYVGDVILNHIYC